MTSEHQFDILAINESKFNTSISDGLVNIQDYKLERNDRYFNGGGGTALYIKDSLNDILRTDLIPDDIEMVAIEIVKRNVKSFIVSTWYRPSDATNNIFENSRIF